MLPTGACHGWEKGVLKARYITLSESLLSWNLLVGFKIAGLHGKVIGSWKWQELFSEVSILQGLMQ